MTGLLIFLVGAPASAQDAPFEPVYLAGEPGAQSIILQARVQLADSTIGEVPGYGDIPGYPGWARFELAEDQSFRSSRTTAWRRLDGESDHIVKEAITGLAPDRTYYYRAWAGPDTVAAAAGKTARFRTLPAPTVAAAVRFVMVSCMNYEKFYGIGSMQTQNNPAEWVQPATGNDRVLGFPGFEAVLAREPDFWIGNGDNVYYDSPTEQPDLHARTREELRAKWHRQLHMPRLRRVAERSPVFFLKDDHDYRFNDADTTDTRKSEPSHQLGIAMFREQVPVVDPMDEGATTYRTVRAGTLLQLWFLEGRDYRSPNAMPDGPEKTLWGDEQEAWLKRTLLESDAPFRILVSPTPLVGPDDAHKRDNHANLDGFHHEGQEFIRWLEANRLTDRVFVLNGDRHWQYHSIHPSGLEEFSSGALVSQNAREGREPGDPGSTDPRALIDQPYIQRVPVGGFLQVEVETDAAGERPSIVFSHWDEQGKLLYAARRYAEP